MKRIACALCAMIYLLLALAGCGAERASAAEHTFFAMDTLVTIRLSAGYADGTAVSEEERERLFREADQIVADMENGLSRTVADSDTARLSSSETGITCTSDALPAVLARALEIAEATGGAFSPAMGTLTDLWNVSGGGPVPSDEARAEAMAHTDWRTLTVDGNTAVKSDPDLRVDLGGIAKGYTVQRLCEYLEGTGVAWGIVSLGGNVGVFGEKPDGMPYKIGITDPLDSASLAGFWHIGSGTIAVSGDYERFFIEDGVRYHHIFDPATGMPADSGLCSVAVFSEDGALADALSTALFIMGAEEALAYYDAHPGTFEAILITKSEEILLTPGLTWNEDFTPAGDSYTYNP